MFKFDQVFNSIMFDSDSTKNILITEGIKNYLKKGRIVDELSINVEQFIIEETILIQGFLDPYIIRESKDPDYYAKFPKELHDLTIKKVNQIITKQDLMNLFPFIKDYSFPNIIVISLDFRDKKIIKEFLNSIGRFNNETINFIFRQAFRDDTIKGLFIDLTKFKQKTSFLLLNKFSFNDRTIYHQWTHAFQTYIGDQYKILLDKNNIQLQNKDQGLRKFGLTPQFADVYLFSQKEYITRLDNLLYAIHQVQKEQKYKKLTDQQFFKLFKDTFSTNDPICLETQLARQFIVKNFKIDLLFFISCFISFKESLFQDLCFDLEKRL